MSRRNNVRGPTSALTEFLKESGITPTTIARRVRTRVVEQPVPGPSTVPEAEEGNADAAEGAQEEYDSENLDEPEAEKPALKKRKLTNAAEAKLKAKAKAKKKQEDGDYQDSDEDAYTALSKMWKDDTKPANGSFCDCAKCGKQFTVTKYTMVANPPPGYLCHPCYKASGADPFKKPTATRKRKIADKRTVTNYEERRINSLVSLCVKVITLHINDVEALGDIGSQNLDQIAKAIAKDRSLTPENATLFYDVENTSLTLYDATNLIPTAFTTLALLNPNLTSMKLEYCGCMDDSVVQAWSRSLPNLTHIELLGPFLVHSHAWTTFFKSHRKLVSFLLTQSPRFDLECMESLVTSCKGLTELRLKEIGQMSDEFLVHIQSFGDQLTYLDLSRPGKPEALSTEALVDLMSSVGSNLTHLDLSWNTQIQDGFLYQGLKPYARRLHNLILSNVPDLTDAGVAEFFDTWESAADKEDREIPNPPLMQVDLSRNHELAGAALKALLKHSGAGLEVLNISGWKATPQKELQAISRHAPKLRVLNIGWCREVDNWVVKDVLDRCKLIKEIHVWGCQRLSEECPLKRNVLVQGVEAHSF